jgi:type I restriction enzyme M protein
MSLSSFIWSLADLLRGDYKQSEYGKVILPVTVLCRMDCVLGKTKESVLAENKARKKSGINPEPFLLRKAKQSFYNTDHLKENLYSYLQAFSPSGSCEKFDISRIIRTLDLVLERSSSAA